MCIFTKPVGFVGRTKIFARLTGAGTQFLVYQMEYESGVPNAMILPLPIELPARENSVRFIDLSSDESFFEILEQAFPGKRQTNGFGCSSSSKEATRVLLAVHKIGRFVASFVPTLADFGRLDPQFTLPSETWEKIPSYSDYGFAVFQLAELSAKPHPMAFEFETRTKDVFFPTVHIHDGEVHAEESFDHTLYLQHAGYDSVVDQYENYDIVDRNTGFVRSKAAVKHSAKAIKAQPLLAPELLLHRLNLKGRQKNIDLVYKIPGNPLFPSFNYRNFRWIMPWAVLLVATTWFFNRRRRLKKSRLDSV